MSLKSAAVIRPLSCLLLLVLLLSLSPACKKSDSRPVSQAKGPLAATACTAPTLEALVSTAPVVLDGKLLEEDWRNTRSTGPFLSETYGKPISPHSELRALWTEAALVIGLYAGDEDLRSSDAFTLRVVGKGAPLLLRISARGELSCPSDAGADACLPASALTSAVDADGTFEDASDFDEEWLAELVIPWATLGFDAPPASVQLNAWRTDTPKGATPRTTAWACASTESLGAVKRWK